MPKILKYTPYRAGAWKVPVRQGIFPGKPGIRNALNQKINNYEDNFMECKRYPGRG